MQLRRAIPCVALAALMAGALATSASAAPTADRSEPSSTAAFASSARGDNWIAANQFEQARAANDSLANRFNLAVAYETTGRGSEAASLYRTILRPAGQATPFPLDGERTGEPSTLAMSQEAGHRLARIDARRGKPASADFEAGASASAFVGGPSSGRVSNANARRLDKAARHAIGE